MPGQIKHQSIFQTSFLEPVNYPGMKLHGIAPYAGRIRPSLVRQLINSYSKENDLIWDPFCGSGTIPLEAVLLNRRVICADVNPYALAITKAKLNPPRTLETLAETLEDLESNYKKWKLESSAPLWVRRFFHPTTLKNTRKMMLALNASKNHFLMGCLLGILHHQRSRFLSFPASNYAPYLRDKSYPRERFPEMYSYRDPMIRLKAKAYRIMNGPEIAVRAKSKVINKSAKQKYVSPNSVDMILTSPPYMDAIDYSRDNRLRLWFLGVCDYKKVKTREIRNVKSFRNEMAIILSNMNSALRHGGKCILVLGDVNKKHKTYDVPMIVEELITENLPSLKFLSKSTDLMPDAKKASKNGRSTKTETVLVFEKVKGAK